MLMTDQEVFNTVWNHIIQQGKPSLDKFGSCLYRGENGEMCAAGVLLPEDYVEEGTPADEIPYIVENFNVKLVQKLQDSHDRFADFEGQVFVENFKESARKVAKDFKLTVPKE